ncbi:hypothetical protein SYNTR_0952 [Candidatus Syntrophocurvum alkaliphilum]|uniref:CRISPR-associated protein, Cse2 family n=1 Tax=Candidatus Syntrophocurvum alkaliphilum TaxID=2293317 RepID=A0A6I6D9U2_9FIRM|nr:type I-E CRISPR-associated protein Cse2/CasB [Candidatus Syntrophocurvum alkaliphilum]QGT99545.1 hypothetical protein SYNTR_0952 [Candidatus Syntrophocurvum alkaliphilum]
MADEVKKVSNFVKYQISRLSGSSNEAAARATLAKLRRGIGNEPGSMPELWDITLNGLDESLTSKDGAPTRGEWAVHTALTLYALHQQGADMQQNAMSKDKNTLGTSLRKLIKNEEDEIRVKRRFDAAATSDSLAEFSHHLRGLIQLLKSQDIPLDYPELAKDLYLFQFPEARDSVRLRWGREFYRIKSNVEGDGNLRS